MKRYFRIVAAVMMLLALPVAGSAGAKIKNLCEVRYPSDSLVKWSCRTLKWQDTPTALFGERWGDVLRFNRLDRRHFIGGVSIKVPKHLEQIERYTPMPLSYPDAARDPKFILINQFESFLGAYEYGKLVLSFPCAIGIENHRVPNGVFQIDAADRGHESNLYVVVELERPYPMHYGLRFFVDKNAEGWPSYWIHGRDVPGYPASHGCIGLYDEEMQVDYYSDYDRKVNKPYYHEITKPYLEGAQKLYDWVIDPRTDPGSFHEIKNGPRVLVIGEPPL
jgi:hypothetical protein